MDNIPSPVTREDEYLSRLCGRNGHLPDPVTRKDMYLHYLCENAGGDGSVGQPVDPLPSGGAAGQHLAKRTAADGDVEWVDPPVAGGSVSPLPAGGAPGKHLAKRSWADGDCEWVDPPEYGGEASSVQGDSWILQDVPHLGHKAYTLPGYRELVHGSAPLLLEAFFGDISRRFRFTPLHSAAVVDGESDTTISLWNMSAQIISENVENVEFSPCGMLTVSADGLVHYEGDGWGGAQAKSIVIRLIKPTTAIQV